MSKEPRTDVYARVTAKIVADLEQGVRPWLKPWNAEHAAGRISRPLRANGQPYRGVNVLLLWGEAQGKGYNAPIWITYKQAATLGGQVRKGEHGSLVVYADRFTKTETDEQGHLDDAGAAYLFIDTAPSVGAVNAELFAVADLILIPLNPTPADLRALIKGLPLIKQSGKPFKFLLSRVRPNLRNNDSTAMALESLGLVLPARMHERVVYAETFAHGKTALEVEPKGAAAQEMFALWQAVSTTLAESEKVRNRESKRA